jgi:hypothetical protein
MGSGVGAAAVPRGGGGSEGASAVPVLLLSRRGAICGVAVPEEQAHRH